MARFQYMLLLVICVFVVGCGGGGESISNAGLSEPPVSFRWVVSDSTRDLIGANVLTTGERVFVHREIIADGNDVEFVAAIRTEAGDPALALQFTHGGRDLLHVAWMNYSGKRVALVVDGFVVCAVDFDGPLGEYATLESFSMYEAEAVARRMNYSGTSPKKDLGGDWVDAFEWPEVRHWTEDQARR